MLQELDLTLETYGHIGADDSGAQWRRDAPKLQLRVAPPNEVYETLRPWRSPWPVDRS